MPAAARQDLFAFAVWMFWRRKHFRWMYGDHHKVVCDALMRVYRGECKRLIINIPPRYSKTELAVVNFIAWCFGKVPDAEFIHASYSGALAVNNSTQVRGLVQHEAYREIFPQLQLASDAQHHWKTTAGGVMYATGTGGTITGFGAGKHRPGFGGCFPYEQLVETEIGPLAIGDIVTRRMPVRVWSWNERDGRPELMPIDTFWTNPANDILEVQQADGGTFRCTPNHELLTSAGWMAAGALADALDLVEGKPGLGHRLSAGLRRIGSSFDGLRRMLGLVLPVGIREGGCNAGPGLPQLDLADDAGSNPIASRKGAGAVRAGEDGDNLFARQLGTGPALQEREGSVADRILHVIGLRSPREVARRVVVAVAVEMAGLVRLGARAYERLKDKVRDVPSGHLAADRQVDPEITLAVVAGLEHAQRDIPPNAAAGGDRVQTIGPRYVKPSFIRRIGRVDRTFCLEVRCNHNFILAQSGAIVSNCIIIDDPHKADEARSDVMRQGVIDWFQTTLESRKNSPDTPIIVIMQRLHEQDLAGWLLGDRGKDGTGPAVAGGNGEVWENVCLPVWNDDGTPLWPEKHDADTLRRMEKAAPYVFAGQYRQRPAPPEGGVIKPDMLVEVDAVPPGVVEWCRGWDLGASASGDFTAGAKVGRLADGRYVIAGMVREQFETNQRDALILTTAKNDGRMLKQSIPQDPGQAGKPIWEKELIVMGNGSLQELSQVVVGDEVIGHDGRPHRVSHVFEQGELPTTRITTESGRQIVAARDHPFLTPDGWLEAGNLKIGDTLALRSRPSPTGASSRSLEEFRLAGYFVGDGAVGRAAKSGPNGSCHAEFTCADEVQLRDFTACTESLGGSVVRRTRDVSFGTKGLQDWLRETSLAGHTAYNKRVPAWVFTASAEQVAHFLGAYFACDGTISKHGDELIFYSVSRGLLEDVRHLLLRVGISSTLKRKNGKYLETRHESWLLRTRQQDDAYGRFARRIPIFHGAKGERVKTVLAAARFRRFDEEFLPDRVAAVEDAGVRPCRCLTVEDASTFLVRDVVVHNSQVAAFAKLLAGHNVHFSPESGDKVVRATPLASQINAGQVLAVRGPWLQPFKDECRMFPNGSFDDQVDAASRAFNALLHPAAGIFT